MRVKGTSWFNIGKSLGCDEKIAKREIESGWDRQREEDKTVDTGVQARITTLAQLLEECEVDLTVWEVKDFLVNKWEVGAKGPTGKILVEPLFQVKAWLRRIPGAAIINQIKADALEDIANAKKPQARPVMPIQPRGHLLELATVDLHIGKLAWAEEVGTNYDIDIAEDLHTKAVEDLLAKASGFPVEQCLFLVGNDLLHIDNLTATTFGGTRMDVDTRYPKIFRRARQLMCWTIDRLLAIAPVHAPVVPGNHDRLSAFTIGEVLEAWYRGHAHVTIDNSPATRKYYRYGTSLLGFTHGSEEKISDLPLIMAKERRADWSETTQHEWHIGHVHRMRDRQFIAGDSFAGVRVRTLPTLTAHDAWHNQQGYMDRRASEAYLWHCELGYAGHFSSNVHGS